MEKIEHTQVVPDVIIVDICMPVMNGFETAKALLGKYPQINILAFSMNDDEKDVMRMLRCGSKGYILKGADPEEMKKAIKIVYEGGWYFSIGISEIAGRYYTNYNKK